MIIEIIISELDFHLIERIRELRIKANMSQVAFAHKIGVSEGYIGNIENHKQPNKYNIRMLSRVAIALGLNSYLELFPEKIYAHDLVKIKITLPSKDEFKDKINNTIPRFSNITITPLSEIEILNYDKNLRAKK